MNQEWYERQLRLLADMDNFTMSRQQVARWASHLYGNQAQIEIDKLTKLIRTWAEETATDMGRWPHMIEATVINDLAHYIVTKRVA